MRTPIAAMLWENWRLTRVEAAQRLGVGIVGGSAIMLWFGASAPDEAAGEFWANITLWHIILTNFTIWMSIAKLKGGRFLDGYRPGFPLSLLYTRPVRTAIVVGVPMAFQAALAASVYLLSALVLRLTFDFPFPLLSVAAPIAAAHLGQLAGDWSTRSKVAQWLGTASPLMVVGLLATFRWQGPAAFAFGPADYALMASIGLVAFGVAIAGVARQRRGDAGMGISRIAGSPGYPDWLVSLFRFPCPTSSATQAQVWFDLKSSGLPVLAIGLAFALVNLVLFAVSVPVELVRPLALAAGVLSVPTVLTLGGNAFGVRSKQGRTYASVFEATQGYDTTRLAALKVLVRSVCVLGALVVVGLSLWVSLSFIAVGDGYEPLRSWQRGIEGALGRLTEFQVAALAIATSITLAGLAIAVSIGVVVMVAVRAALTALRARYPRGVNIAGALLLVWGFAFVLLDLARKGRIGSASLQDALLDADGAIASLVLSATTWIALGIVLATIWLLWSSLAERLLTTRQACGVLLVSSGFGAVWVTLLHAAGVPLTTMPAADALWMLSPALLPLFASVLTPWSLSRIRHT